MTDRCFMIEPADADDADACEAILRSLPEWFGAEGAICEYRRDFPKLETYVARSDGAVIGMVSIDRQDARRARIHVMAVRREHHRRGVGGVLIEHAQTVLAGQGLKELEVRTLGPSQPDEGYAGTRAFYAAMGFEPVKETMSIWGHANPCLIMDKRLMNPADDDAAAKV